MLFITIIIIGFVIVKVKRNIIERLEDQNNKILKNKEIIEELKDQIKEIKKNNIKNSVTEEQTRATESSDNEFKKGYEILNEFKKEYAILKESKKIEKDYIKIPSVNKSIETKLTENKVIDEIKVEKNINVFDKTEEIEETEEAWTEDEIIAAEAIRLKALAYENISRINSEKSLFFEIKKYFKEHILKIFKFISNKKQEKELEDNKTRDTKEILNEAKEKIKKYSLKSLNIILEKINIDLNEITKFEFWLSKIGIGLLLIGVAFLFKYSLDNNWITSRMQNILKIIIGFIIGMGLEIFGIRLYKKREKLNKILIGGGIGVFYITTFASFQLYFIISYTVAFILMLIITLYAFLLSLNQDEVILSLIGFIGAIGTPFFLYGGSGDVSKVILYIYFIVLGTSLIYLYKGWLSLLWVAILGSWPILIMGIIKSNNLFYEKIIIQIGIILYLVSFWAIPLLREILWNINPKKWRKTKICFLEKNKLNKFRKSLEKHLQILIVIIPFITLISSIKLWGYKNIEVLWGLVALLITLLYLSVGIYLKNKKIKGDYEFIHWIVSSLFLTISVVMFFKGNLLIIFLSVEAILLTVISRKIEKKIIEKLAHLIFFIIGVWLSYRMTLKVIGIPFLNLQAITDIIVIGLGIIMIKQNKNYKIKQVYKFFFGYAIILAFFWREFATVKDGKHLIALAWGISSLLEYKINKKESNDFFKIVINLIFTMIFLYGMYSFVMEKLLKGKLIFDISTITDIILIIIGFTISKYENEIKNDNLGARFYKVGSYLAIFGLTWKNLSGIGADNNYVILTWTIIGGVIHILAHRKSDKFMQEMGNYLFLLLGGLLGYRILEKVITFQMNKGIPFINIGGGIDLFVIAVGVGVSTFQDREKKITYQIVSYILFLSLIIREFFYINIGMIFVLWTVSAITIYLISKYKKEKYLKYFAYVTDIILAIIFLLKLPISLFFKERIFNEAINIGFILYFIVLDLKILKNKIIWHLIGAYFLLLYWSSFIILHIFNIKSISTYGYLLAITWIIETVLFYLYNNKKENKYLKKSIYIGVGIISLVIAANLIENCMNIKINKDVLFLNIRTFTVLIFSGFAIWISKRDIKKIKEIYLISSIFFILMLLYIELSQINMQLVILAWGITAFTVRYILIKREFEKVKKFVNLQSVTIVMYILLQMKINHKEIFFFNFSTLVNLIIILFALYIGKILKKSKEKNIYYITAIGLFFAVIVREGANLLSLQLNIILLLTASEALLVHKIAENKKDLALKKSGEILQIISGILLFSVIILEKNKISLIGSLINFPILINLLVVISIYLTLVIIKNNKDKQKLEIKIYKSIVIILPLIIFFKVLYGFGYSFVMIAWIIEGIILLYISRIRKEDITKIAFDKLVLILAIFIVYRTADILINPIKASAIPMLNIVTFSDILIMVVIILKSSKVVGLDELEYKGYFHLMMLAILFREFYHISNGQAFVTIVWGIYTLTILVLGLLDKNKLYVITSVLTLIGIVIKMFIIDLSQVEAIWKIILFIGFGIIFLITSYYFKILWKKQDLDN